MQPPREEEIAGQELGQAVGQRAESVAADERLAQNEVRGGYVAVVVVVDVDVDVVLEGSCMILLK